MAATSEMPMMATKSHMTVTSLALAVMGLVEMC